MQHIDETFRNFNLRFSFSGSFNKRGQEKNSALSFYWIFSPTFF